MQLFDGTQAIGGPIAVGANGLWSETVTLSGAGTHTITATDTDLANNVGKSAALALALDNQVTGQPGQFRLLGTGGSDHIIVGANNVIVETLGANDTVSLTSAGGAGQYHILVGGGGAETLKLNSAGGALEAGSGADVLIGGAGAGTFEFLSNFGLDTITNFHVAGPSHDIFAISQSLFANWQTLDAVLSDTAAGAKLTLSGNESITFSGVTKAQLQANHLADFRFV